MVTQLIGKVIVHAVVLISWAIIIFIVITEQGMLGTEEHVVTVQWKNHEFYPDPGGGCWNDFFADEEGNVYNTDPSIYAKLEPGYTYYIKTGKSFLFGRLYVLY